MVPQNFRPLLAVNYEKVVEQPAHRYVSEKIDGVRVIFFDGTAYSRSLKPLPNSRLQLFARKHRKALEGCDGELVSGNLYARDVLQNSVSVAMSIFSDDPFRIYLFDRYIQHTPWYKRFSTLLNADLPSEALVLPHYEVHSEDDINKFEQNVLARGGEGVMVRDAEGLYKFGRSGVRQPQLQKVKRFKDTEVEIIGYAPLEHNDNEAEINELGYTSRSSSKEGKVTLEKLGSLHVRLPNNVSFWVGSGFTERQRDFFWNVRDDLLGQKATIKYFRESVDGVPLLPVFVAIRNDLV